MFPTAHRGSSTIVNGPLMIVISALAVFVVVSAQVEEDPFAALEKNIPGAPGEDYPIYASPPETSFLCDGFIQGYYADTEAECQAFHICTDFGTGDLTKYSFLCPNGTLFNQQYFICDWWFNVDCSQVGSNHFFGNILQRTYFRPKIFTV